jgi:hypothetical protein
MDSEEYRMSAAQIRMKAIRCPVVNGSPKAKTAHAK